MHLHVYLLSFCVEYIVGKINYLGNFSVDVFNQNRLLVLLTCLVFSFFLSLFDYHLVCVVVLV